MEDGGICCFQTPKWVVYFYIFESSPSDIRNLLGYFERPFKSRIISNHVVSYVTLNIRFSWVFGSCLMLIIVNDKLSIPTIYFMLEMFYFTITVYIFLSL